MPGIRIKALNEILSPTTKMDADTYGADTVDSDNEDFPQGDGTEEASTTPVDQQSASLKFDVKGSVNSAVKNNYTSGIHIEKFVQMQKDEQQKDVTVDYVHGAKPKIDISIPAKEGETIVLVECTTNEMSQCSYSHNDGKERPFRSKWIFENVPHGLIKVIMKDCHTFFELIDKWEEWYRCKLEKTHNKSCLVLEFLHDSEEDRDRMIQDQENVKEMFMGFLRGIGKDAPSCSLDVCSESAPASIPDEYVKESTAANPKDTNTSESDCDSDCDIFFDATDKLVEDKEQAANLSSISVIEGAKGRIRLKTEGTSIMKTPASESESSLVSRRKEISVEGEDYDGQERSSRFKQIFKIVVPHGPIDLKDFHTFPEIIKTWKEPYRSKLKTKRNTLCLVIEFLRATEADTDRMMHDLHLMQMMFIDFLSDIGKDASHWSMEVYNELATANIRNRREIVEDMEGVASLPSQSLNDEEQREFLPSLYFEKSGHVERLHIDHSPGRDIYRILGKHKLLSA